MRMLAPPAHGVPSLFEAPPARAPQIPDSPFTVGTYLKPNGKRKSRSKVRVVDSKSGQQKSKLPTYAEYSRHSTAPLRTQDKPKRSPPPPVIPATPAELDFRHSGWWARRAIIRKAMEGAGYAGRRLERFDNCGAYARVVARKDTGAVKYRASFCHDRFCTPCTVAKSLQIADNLTKHLAGSKERHYHVVLTLAHRDEPLTDQIDRLYSSFAKLRSRRLWKGAYSAGAYFFQAHVSENDGLWHPHLHVICAGQYLPQADLKLAWLQVTGDSDNVHISAVRADSNVAKEVSRYAAKPIAGNLLNDQDKLQELLNALRGRRVCSTFGTWRKLKITAKPKPDPTIEWVDLGSLESFIHRARQGDEHAIRILKLITTRDNPATGPPALWNTPLVRV